MKVLHVKCVPKYYHAQGDLMILTFHESPLARRYGLYDKNSEKYKKMGSPGTSELNRL